MDLLKILQKLPFAPPIFNEELMAKFGEKVVLPDAIFPKREHAYTSGLSLSSLQLHRTPAPDFLFAAICHYLVVI